MNKLSNDFNQDEQKLICCDCNGTLFGATNGLHKELFQTLIAAKKAGFEVVVFSNDAANNQDTLDIMSNLYTKDSRFFGDVRDKSDFTGRTALMVFDDDHNSHRVNAAMTLDPWKDLLKIRDLKKWFESGAATKVLANSLKP